MDSSMKQPSLSLFALLVLSSPFTTTNGSDRLFFSKMSRTEQPMLHSEQPIIPTNLPLKSHSEHGYALYSHPEQFEPKNAQNLSANIPEEKPMNENYSNQYGREHVVNTNNNPSEFTNYEFSEGGFNSNNNNNDNYQQRYGMSDTRFMNNGRYYYNVNSKRYGYRFESNPMRTNSEEYIEYGPDGKRIEKDGNEAYGYENENEYNNNGVNEFIP